MMMIINKANKRISCYVFDDLDNSTLTIFQNGTTVVEPLVNTRAHLTRGPTRENRGRSAVFYSHGTWLLNDRQSYRLKHGEIKRII